VIAFVLLIIAGNPYAPCKVSHYLIHDGDTLKAYEVQLPFGVSLRDQSVRADGYDAWEIDRTRKTIIYDKDELEKGIEARRAFSNLLDDGGLWIDETGKRDPYGRLNARLWTKDRSGKWIDVAEWMKEHGHARTVIRPPADGRTNPDCGEH